MSNNTQSYRMSSHNVIHGVVLYDQWGKAHYVKLKDPIYVPVNDMYPHK